MDFFVPYKSSYLESTIPLNKISSNKAGIKQINKILNIISNPLPGTNDFVMLYILSLKKRFAIGANIIWFNTFVQIFTKTVSKITSKMFIMVILPFLFTASKLFSFL